MKPGWTRADEERKHDRLLRDARDRFDAVARAAMWESRLGAAFLLAATVLAVLATTYLSLANSPWMVDPVSRTAASIGCAVVGLVACAGLLYVKTRLGKWVMSAHETYVRAVQGEMERYGVALRGLPGEGGQTHA